MRKELLFLLGLISTVSFSQTFDWETASNSANGIVQTVSGVTATFSTSANDQVFTNASGISGTSGIVVFTQTANSSASATVSFSTPVAIATIFAFDADLSGGSTWTFTPSGGTNPSVSQFVSASTGATVTVNWTNVTSFTMTSSQGNESFGLDDIVLGTTLNVNSFSINDIKIYPNPSSEAIYIKGLSEIKGYRIYNLLGAEVIGGIISNSNKVDIQNLAKGAYVLKFDDGNTFKFVKE